MLIAFAVVAGWPLLRSIWFSLTDASLTKLYSAEWIGFGNYLSSARWRAAAPCSRGVLVDPAWWNAVGNTVRFAVGSVPGKPFSA